MSILDKARKTKAIRVRIARKGTTKKSPKKVVKTKREVKPPPSVIGIIEDVTEGDKLVRNFFRPSSLTAGACPRANVFHYINADTNQQDVGPRLRRILDNGSAVHAWIQEKYLNRHEKYWFISEPKVATVIHGAHIRGSCDGVLIRRSDGYRFGIEIKTISTKQFEKLTKPQQAHVDQARIYMRLQNLDYIVVVYWSKNDQFLKEFPVKDDDAEWKKFTDRIKKLKGYVDAFKKRKDPNSLPQYDRKKCSLDFCRYKGPCKKYGAPIY